MKQKFLFLVVILFTTLIAWTQPNSNYYYYQSLQSPITLSEKDMYVKFLPNISNTQKLTVINQAQVDIIGSDPNNLPDVIRLRSRILQRQVWVFPCGPILEAKTKFSKKELEGAIFQKPAPCADCPPPPPPPPCTTPPYQIWQSYDNFFEALIFFGNQNEIRSASKAIIKSNGEAVGTCEDFYIKLKPTFSIADLGSLITYYGLTATDVSSSMGAGIYRIDETRGGSRFCLERANIFFETGKCEISHPNFYITNAINTADPEYGNQWSLLNTGQYSGIVGADIRIEQAWQITRGNPNIKIAVLDNGVQLNHPDLQANLLPGFDALGAGTAGGATGSASHGTACAGIIGAIADNNIGITGIAPNCRIIPVRIGEANNINIAAATAGLNWAVDNGASIISSWGGGQANDLFEIAVNRATTIGRGGKGCLLFFASGNENVGVSWPAILPNVMSVGAINMCNQRKSPQSCDNESQWGSNYGQRLDYVAPSPKITTLTINSGIRNEFNGTSAATPHAAGIAALLLSVNPNLTLAEARKLLDYSCNKVGAYCYEWTTAQPNRPNSGWNEQTGYGRLNAFNAVQLARQGVTISNPTYNVAAQSNSQVTGNIGVVFGGLSCPATLPFGVYFVRRYQVLANITYPSTLNPIIVCSSNGFSQASPSAGQRWAEAINVTNTSATLRTYVYIGYNSIGQQLGWIPRDPSTVNFTFSVISSPTPINYQLQRGANATDSQFVNSSIPFKLDLNNTIKTNDVPVELTTSGIVSNPVRESVKINIQSVKNETISIQVLSSNGVVMKTQEMAAIQNGITQYEIDTKSLISGLYLLKVSSQKNSKVYKFVKQ